MLTTRWTGYLLHLPRQVSWHGRLTWRQRLLGVLASLSGLLLASAAPALAADAGGFADAFIVRDGHGLTMSQYALNLGGGGWGGQGIGGSISAWLATSMWDVYLIAVSISAWLLHMALAFEWMDVVRGPLELIAGTLHQLIDQAGVVPTAMVLTGALAGLWLFKGRYGAALGEFAYAAVMGALFIGVLSNPVTTITGPQGLLTRSQQLATEAAGQIMTAGQLDGTGPLNPHAPHPRTGVGSATDLTVVFAAANTTNTPAARAQTKIEGRLIEIFVRVPHQIINYGSVIDGRDPRCAKVYDDVLAEGPWGEDSAPRDRMGECAKKYGEAAEHPGTAFSSTFVLMPSGGFLVLMLFVLVISLLLSGLLALFEALRLSVEAARGILPGQSRAAFWQALVGMLTAMATTVVLVVFTAIYLQLLSGFFTSNRWNAQQIFVLIDIMLLIGTIMLVVWQVRARKKARQLGRSAASAVSPKPVSIPTRRPLAALAGGAVLARQRSLHGTAGLIGGNSTRPARTPARQGIGAGVRTAVKLGLVSTVGAPVAAPRAVAAARAGLNLKRQALQARFDAARTDAAAYGREYVGNLATAGRFVGTVTGARWAAGHAAAATAAPRAGAVLAGTIATGATSERPQPDAVGRRPPAAHAAPTRRAGANHRPGATTKATTSSLAGAGRGAVPSAPPVGAPEVGVRVAGRRGGAPAGPTQVPVAPQGVPTRTTPPAQPLSSPRERLLAQLGVARSRPASQQAPQPKPTSTSRDGRGRR